MRRLRPNRLPRCSRRLQLTPQLKLKTFAVVDAWRPALVGPPRVQCEPSLIGEHGVFMLVRGGAATEELQHSWSRIDNLVRLPRRNRDGVTGANLVFFVAKADAPGSLQEIIDFLSSRMVVWPRGPTWRQSRFGKALVSNAGIPVSQQFANF